MEIIIHLLKILYFDLCVVDSMYSKKSTQEYLLARREDGDRNGKVVIKNANACLGWVGAFSHIPKSCRFDYRSGHKRNK